MKSAAALVLLLICACSQPVVGSDRIAPPEASARTGDEPLARAQALYRDHCALCHGPKGGGDGVAAHLLYPPARDFTLGFFRLATTENSVPTEDDLVRTLRRGMPGSAMPPFAWMTERDLVDMARLVRAFAREGLLADLQVQAIDDGTPLPAEEAEAIVNRWLEPGPRVQPLPPVDADSKILGRGRDLYYQGCAVCHGLDGRGRGGAPRRHEDGSLTWARDFTAGVLKGGGSRYDLTCRIRAGLGGSAMPPADLPEADLAALVAFVQGLIPAGAPERHHQVRTKLVAGRIDAAPTPAEWLETDERVLHLAPMTWHDESVLDVEASALHDGQHLWIRLRWEDATQSDLIVGGTPYVDAAAVQLAGGGTPPPSGMGQEGSGVNLWHWSAARWSELAGLLERIEGAHGDRVVVDHVDSAIALGAEGFERIDPDGETLGAEASWEAGVWTLVLSRQLERRNPSEMDLPPGSAVQLGVAIWNGAANDHRGQKSVTIWHELELAR